MIFESLNAKGRALTQADLIRNYFFMRLDVSMQEDVYERYWVPMQGNVEEDMTEFMRHFLMKDGGFVKQTEVYSSLKKEVDRQSTQQEAEDYLANMLVYSKLYGRLLRPSLEPSTQISLAMNRLNRIEATTAYPFLLNVYFDYENDRISSESFARILDILESFLVRRFVCGMPTSPLNKVLPTLSTVYLSAPTQLDSITDFLRTKGYPRDGEFKDRLIATKLYGAGDRLQKTKLILEGLELSYGHKESVDLSNVTIEHVMPRKLTKWWKQHLGPEWELVHETHLDTLGNLTLTAYNSNLSNDTVDDKAAILIKSHLELNRDFGGIGTWDETAIRKRATSLADRAVQRWKYFGSDLDKENTNNTIGSVTGRVPTAVVVLGERFPVTTWRDVAQQTMKSIHDLDEEGLVAISKHFPRYLGCDKSRFRAARPVTNVLFMEVNLSASDIYRFCVQASELAGLSTDDWSVELRELN